MLTTEMVPWDGPRRVRVARLGSGPPLVLLHGYPDNLQVFAGLAPRLADRAEVIALDWPGLGYSDPVGGGATPAHLADRLKAILDGWTDLVTANWNSRDVSVLRNDRNWAGG